MPGATAAVYPGVSAAAAATAQTLYGDVSQYDDPTPPNVLVHHPPSPSSSSVGQGEGEEEGHSPGGRGGAGGAGSGGPLTLSSGGPGSSAFSSYVAVTGSSK